MGSRPLGEILNLDAERLFPRLLQRKMKAHIRNISVIYTICSSEPSECTWWYAYFTFLATPLALQHAWPGTGEPKFGYVTRSGISDNIGVTLHLVIRGYSSFHIMHHINNVYWLLTMADSRGGVSSFPFTLNCLLKPTQQQFKICINAWLQSLAL